MNKNMAPWEKFEALVGEIMIASGFLITRNKKRGDAGFDLVGKKDREKWAIEVKYYRTSRARPALVEAAAVRLVDNAAKDNFMKVILVVSSFLTDDLREDFQRRLGVNLLDARGLRAMASKEPFLLERLESMLVVDQIDDDFIRVQDSRFRSDGIYREEFNFENTLILNEVDEGLGKPSRDDGRIICAELHDIPPGRTKATKYEKWCERAIAYMFKNDLEGWHSQKGTDDGLNRFDLICRIKPVSDFWRFLMEHLGSRYILFEFKNYRDPIGQEEVLTTEKYLFEKGLRKVALMITRKGGSGSATVMAQGAMREHGKLMLILDDEDLCHMLKMKDEGEDASDYLFEKADKFLVSLAR